MVEEGSKGPLAPTQLGAGQTFASSRQIKDYLLCDECEALLRTGGEDWLLANSYRLDGRFPIREAILRQQRVSISPNGTDLYRLTDIPEIEVNQMVFFGASILWKAAVHVWRIGRRTINVDLGPYEEQLRAYLNGGVFPDGVCLCVAVSTNDYHSRTMVEPVSGKLHGLHDHTFRVTGLSFGFFIGKRVPASFLAVSCIPGGLIGVNTRSDAEQEERIRRELTEAKR
jgi:hypothetical protein